MFSPKRIEADPSKLLETFIRGERREESFAQIVEHFGGLVYASALRRIGKRELAEEITQTVFSIMARKAPSLAHHPSLAGWVFQTTRLETNKVMRTESRRQRKHQAFAEGLEATLDGVEDTFAWKEILPMLDDSLDELSERDRQVIFGRFFEGRKFHDLAKDHGCSEAASKMQVKRALERLSKLLNARGATFSATTLGAGLASQLVGITPAHASTLAINSLSASSGVSAGTLLTNTLLTMNTAKQSLALIAIMIALASIPVIHQAAEAAQLNDDLDALQVQLEELNLKPSKPRLRSQASHRSSSTTVRELFADNTKEITAEEFLSQLQSATMSQDMLEMLRLFIPLTALDEASAHQLLDDISAIQGFDPIKPMALQMIGNLVETTNPEKMMGRLSASEIPVHSYSTLLTKWASNDPEAALDWYHEKLSTGELAGKGALNSPAEVLFFNLLKGMFTSAPEKMVSLYLNQDDPNLREAAAHSIGLLSTFDNLENKARLKKILNGEENSNIRSSILKGALNSYGIPGEHFDEGLALVKKYVEGPEEQTRILSKMAMHKSSLSFAERADWLMEHIEDSEKPTAISEMITGRSHFFNEENFREMGGWVTQQQNGFIRDLGLRTLSEVLVRGESFQMAFSHTREISDEDTRRKAVADVAEAWLRVDEQEAKRHIPSETLEFISNQ